MQIRAVTRNLTDGSEVTDLILSQDNEHIVLPACSTDDACVLIDKLVTAITTHTVENVTVR
jgi:hypothetical protein